jgi:hypothetical protein
MIHKESFFLILFSLGFLFSPMLSAGSESSGPLPHAEEFTRNLGLQVKDSFSLMETPVSIFPYRGSVSSEDNVVFYYSDSTYFFWFHDRVWQVRADERWQGEVDGVSMGMKLPEIIRLWGPPINNRDEQPTWTLPDRGYPVRIRLYFSDEGLLNDLYVYRSDW